MRGAGHLFPVHRVAAYLRLDPSLVGLGRAVHQGNIDPLDAVFLELPGQFDMGTVVLCHHDDTGGVLVNTMHDTRPNLAANAGKIVAVRQERVHQGSIRIPGTGMHRHSGGLVHYHRVTVLVKDREGNLFGLRNGRCRRGISMKICSPPFSFWEGLAGAPFTVIMPESIRR